MRRSNNEIKNNEDPINIKLVSRAILKSWYLFPIFILLLCGAAYVYLKITPPQYLISSTVIIKEGERNNNVTENAIASDLENLKSSITVENELEKLRSRSLLMNAVIENKGFINFYETSGYFKNKIDPYTAPIEVEIHEFSKTFQAPSEVFEIEIKSESDFELKFGEGQRKAFKFDQKIKTYFGEISIKKVPKINELSTEITQLTIELVNPQVATEAYANVLEFENPSIKSSTLYIRMLDTSPEMGKQIMTSVINGYNEKIVNQKNEAAIKTINFINKRLGIVQEDLEGFEKAGQDFKTRNSITDISMNSKIYLESSAETSKQLAEVNGKIDILESIEFNMNNQNNQFELIPSGLAGLDPSLSGLLSQYNDLLREKQRIIRVVQPNNPQLLSLNDQIANYKANIFANINSIKSNLQISKRNFEATLNESSYRAQSIPGIERELVEIDRNKDLKQEQYQYLLRKRDESALALEITGGTSAQLVDPPIASLKPVKPNKMLIMLGALGLGMCIPLGLIFAKYLLSSKVTSKRTVERILKIPILGEIAKNEEKGVIAITPKSISPPAEQLRMIRNNMKFQSDTENKVIVISSSMSGEGKTFFSINLGVTLSLVDKKVIIVDFDLRRPSILTSLGIKSNLSLIDYLKHDVKDVQNIIVPSAVNEYLDVIGLNKSISNPSEIFNSYKISELIETLKKSYDHIIIDTSPIGLVADAYSLSKISDLMIFVVRMNFTKINQLETLTEIIDNKIFKQNFVVINDSDKFLGSNFGYGYYSAKDKNTVSI